MTNEWVAYTEGYAKQDGVCAKQEEVKLHHTSFLGPGRTVLGHERGTQATELFNTLLKTHELKAMCCLFLESSTFYIQVPGN